MSYINYNQTYRRNRLSEPAQLLAANDFFTPTSDQKYMLGCICDLNDGRRFRYCRDGGSGITKARMSQAAAVTAAWNDEAQTSGTAFVIGDTKVTIGVTTAPTANVWDNGWMLVNNGTGAGEMYCIKEHTLTTTPTVTIADRGGVRVATTTSSDITIIRNTYNLVVVVPAGAGTNMPTGVPLATVTADYYFWAQTKGPCPMYVDTNGGAAPLVVGNMCGEPAAAQDAGTVGVVEADGTLAIYGWVRWIAEDLQFAIVDLNLE